MVSFEKFKDLINHLTENNFVYYVFGGFAIDGLTGSLQREHDDIDIILLEKDKEKAINSLKNKWKILWNKNILKINDNEVNVDILFLNEVMENFELIGNKADTIIPKKFFRSSTKGNIEEFEFEIIPLEWLIQSTPYFDKKTDREILTGLKESVNLDEMKEIKDKTKRDKNDPKLKEHEKRMSEFFTT